MEKMKSKHCEQRAARPFISRRSDGRHYPILLGSGKRLREGKSSPCLRSVNTLSCALIPRVHFPLETHQRFPASEDHSAQHQLHQIAVASEWHLKDCFEHLQISRFLRPPIETIVCLIARLTGFRRGGRCRSSFSARHVARASLEGYIPLS